MIYSVFQISCATLALSVALALYSLFWRKNEVAYLSFRISAALSLLSAALTIIDLTGVGLLIVFYVMWRIVDNFIDNIINGE